MIKATARGSGPYVVLTDEGEYSRHTTEREAMENACEALAEGKTGVHYTHDYVVDVEALAAPDPTPAPEPEPEPEPEPTPRPTGDYRRNMPAGWSVVSDLGMDGNLPPFGGGYYEGHPFADGWLAQDWDSNGGGQRVVQDPSSPISPPHVYEEVYGPGLSGGGPCALYRSLPNVDRLYVSWVVRWEADFDHNTTSEKLISLNLSSTEIMFQFHWGHEVLKGGALKAPPEFEYVESNWLTANQMPQLPPDWNKQCAAPWPSDADWHEYEFLLDRTTGEVRWWQDGVLHGSYTGQTLPTFAEIMLNTTWGGGGNKRGTHSRYTAHVTVAAG